MTGFGGAASGFVAGAMAATGFLGGVFVIAVLAVGLRAGNLATLALVAGALVAGARFAAIVLANLFAADVFAADFFVVFFAAATVALYRDHRDSVRTDGGPALHKASTSITPRRLDLPPFPCACRVPAAMSPSPP
jgi:hypothetical protein